VERKRRVVKNKNPSEISPRIKILGLIIFDLIFNITFTLKLFLEIFKIEILLIKKLRLRNYLNYSN